VEAFFRGRTFDHVVSSASQTRVSHIKEMSLEDAYASMNSKFWGFFRIARAATIAPGGSLTIVTGFRSIRPARGNALQGAINAGLEGLVRGLALELAPVRVNAVSPGFTNTPLLGPLTETERQAKLAQVAATVPAGVAGQPEHMAIQITACMLNPYMTGATVYIEGGAALI
jgi:NAD(P)-dependent dehydrogenase (short-subunit alcohol dehydrogenase family)